MLSADMMFVLAVLTMATATYALRVGGYWIMGRLPLTDRVRRGLEALPGAIIVSTVLPIVLQGDLVVGVSVMVAVAVQIGVKKEYAAVFCAVCAAAALRAMGL